ncbi:serine/threonine-protein kinase [Sanguibacter massiliensis]|uniref:serine/threonine-protein kinase n=1 Tax=Sanguibacter massiliensis TaxID=1973217 RepID=UPI000C82C9FF|nr:serine/threonine-protein kinase [Sanguibacter massiliensis]
MSGEHDRGAWLGRLHEQSVPGLDLREAVARGASATVYRAIQESVDREVAVKIWHAPLVDAASREAFRTEARAAGVLSGHAGIAAVHDAGIDARDRPYLVMELCRRGSLADLLRSGPLDGEQAVRVGVGVADALAASHAIGIVHRDVKPGNILISDYGEPLLGDFGIAALVDSDDALHAFTPAYAAPEVLDGASSPDPRQDVFSLAATVHALVAGAPRRAPEDAPDPVAALATLEFAELAPRGPDGLDAVLARALDPDPRRRTASATMLRDELRSLLGPRRRARGRTVAIAAAVTVGVAAAVGGLWLLDRAVLDADGRTTPYEVGTCWTDVAGGGVRPAPCDGTEDWTTLTSVWFEEGTDPRAVCESSVSTLPEAAGRTVLPVVEQRGAAGERTLACLAAVERREP